MPPGTTLHADALDRAELIEAGFPAARLRSLGAPVTAADAVLLATRPGAVPTGSCAAGELRATLPWWGGAPAELCGAADPVAMDEAERARTHPDRHGAGREPRPAARPGTRPNCSPSGRVDPRLMIVLSVLATSHTLTVSDFPTAPYEPADSLRRQVLLGSVDGLPTDDTPAPRSCASGSRGNTPRSSRPSCGSTTADCSSATARPPRRACCRADGSARRPAPAPRDLRDPLGIRSSDCRRKAASATVGRARQAADPMALSGGQPAGPRGWLPSRLVQLLNSRTAAARLIVAAAGVAVLSLATACGSGATTPAAAPAAPATVADTAAQAADGHGGHGGMAGMGSTDLELYAVQTGTLGVVVTDGEGRVLYGSDADQTDPPQSHCTDACAQTWLPLTVPAGQEPQLLGVDEPGRRTAGPAGRQQPADAGRLAGLRQPQRRRPAQAGRRRACSRPGLVRDVPGRGRRSRCPADACAA